MDIISDIIRKLQAAEDGEIDALLAYIELKRIFNVLEASIKQIQPLALAEANKYGEKSFKAFGASITLKSNPGQWKYEGCDDVLLAAENLKKLQENSKNAYKLAIKGQVVVDDDSVIIPAAQYTPGADSISISEKK